VEIYLKSIRILVVAWAILLGPASAFAEAPPTDNLCYKDFSFLVRTKLAVLERVSPDKAIEYRAKLAQKAGWYSEFENYEYRRMISEDLDEIINAQARGEREIRTLQQMGVRIVDGKLEMPSLAAQLLHLEKEIDKLPIPKESKLYPARMFKMPDGSIIVRRVGENIPKGAKTYKGTLDAEDFAFYVGQGYYPVGDPRSLVNDGYPAFWHDLIGHFGGFMDDPQYMAAVREINRKLAKNKVRLSLEEWNPATRQPGYNTDLLTRLNHAQESLILTPTSQRPYVANFLKKVGVSNDRSHTQDEIRTALGRHSDEQIEALIREIGPHHRELYQEHGGTARDLFERAAMGQRHFQGEADSAYVQSPYVTGSYLSNPIVQARLKPPQKRELLARYLTMIDHTSQISPSQWLREVSNPGPLPRGSSVYRYICKSGLFNSKNFQYYGAFCD
jgi:hypothetical protein